MNHNEKKVILKVEDLKQYFQVSSIKTVKAIDDISFEIYEGETFGLVGESGSGKSTTGRTILNLYTPTEGKITFDGKDITKVEGRKNKLALARDMQMIFQ